MSDSMLMRAISELEEMDEMDEMDAAETDAFLVERGYDLEQLDREIKALVAECRQQWIDDQAREDAIAGLSIAVHPTPFALLADDYEQARWAGDLGGIEL